jgi:ABC-type nitrate/sulfonate/bicarbonate transport system substrate-binding protein
LKHAKFLTACLFVYLLTALCLFGCKSTSINTDSSPVPAKENPKIRIGFVDKNLGALPAVVGVKKRIIDRGTLTGSFDTDPAVLDALAKGAIDIGYVDPVAALAYADQTQVQVVAVAAREGCAIVVHDGEIHSPVELATRIFSVRAHTSVPAWLLNVFAKKHKLDGQLYVSEVAPDQLYPQMFKRYADGFAGAEPLVTTAIANENTGVIARSAQLAPGHAHTYVVAGPAFAKDARLPQFVNTHAQAAAWIGQHPDEAAAIAAKLTKQSEADIAKAMEFMKFEPTAVEGNGEAVFREYLQ